MINLNQRSGWLKRIFNFFRGSWEKYTFVHFVFDFFATHCVQVNRDFSTDLGFSAQMQFGCETTTKKKWVESTFFALQSCPMHHNLYVVFSLNLLLFCFGLLGFACFCFLFALFLMCFTFLCFLWLFWQRFIFLCVWFVLICVVLFDFSAVLWFVLLALFPLLNFNSLLCLVLQVLCCVWFRSFARPFAHPFPHLFARLFAHFVCSLRLLARFARPFARSVYSLLGRVPINWYYMFNYNMISCSILEFVFKKILWGVRHF